MAQLDLTKLWTIVPVRGLTAGKSRLTPVLDAAGRAELIRKLLMHTVAVVSEWCGAPQRCMVVSPCSRALALARKAGATTVREGARAVGLNRAVKLGVARAATQGATHVLILPGDLPHVGADALSALVNAARRDRRVVLAPDKSGTGTNALLIGIDTGFEYAFGPASFAAHLTAAKLAGLTVSVVRKSDLEFDLDTPEDLAAWRHRRFTRVTPPVRARPTMQSLRRTKRVNIHAGVQPIEEE